MFYKKLADGSVQCQLCPFKCIIPEGGRGICGVRANVNGTLRAMTYGKPVAVHIDPIEKKPLFHFQPQSKSFSIATAGCNLSCIFCQNWTISQALPEESQHITMMPEQVVQQALTSGCKSIAYTYSEPTVFFEYMYDTGVLAHQAGLKNVWITCGYINEEPLRKLCEVLDGANVDLKGPTQFYQEYTKSGREPVLRTLKILREEGVWVEITNLIIPGANDDPDSIRAMCRWIADSLGTDVPIHFSRFHPNYKLTDRPQTPIKTLRMARQIAMEEGLQYVYIGNAPGEEGEDTFCPTTGEKVIDRKGFWILEYKVSPQGKCPDGTPLPGVWK
ncbi:AmmeMemoRadiSam system radical SAM enzyme [bacterium]|nr:MAG: AmmeMemoRadiSam system radical SAM enzyme [bacterium]